MTKHELDRRNNAAKEDIWIVRKFPQIEQQVLAPALAREIGLAILRAQDSLSGEPVVASQSEPTYLLYFEDASVADEVFTDGAAAEARYREASQNWACHLFVKVIPQCHTTDEPVQIEEPEMSQQTNSEANMTDEQLRTAASEEIMGFATFSGDWWNPLTSLNHAFDLLLVLARYHWIANITFGDTGKLGEALVSMVHAGAPALVHARGEICRAITTAAILAKRAFVDK